MTIDWDNCPSNTSFLEDPTDPENRELSENETAEDQLRKALEKAYTTDKLSKQVKFNAVCLRKLKDTRKNEGLIRVKARIPEIHSLLPKPKSKTDYTTMSMYPTFVALKTSFSNQAQKSSDSIPAGTILTVTFGNMSNFGDPRILEIGNIIGSNARGSGDDGLFTERGGSTTKFTGPDLENLSKKLASNKRLNFGIPRRSYGTPKMKEFLQDVSLIKVPADDIWYIQDISEAYGETIGSLNKQTGLWKRGHSSHQSGVDVDISIPLKAFDQAADYPKKGNTAKRLGQSVIIGRSKIETGDNRKKWSWSFRKKKKKYVTTGRYPVHGVLASQLDMNSNIAFLCVCAHHNVKNVFLDNEFINKIRSTIPGSNTEARAYWLIYNILNKDYFSDGLLDDLIATPAATTGSPGTAWGPAALYFAEKIFDKKWLSHVAGHMNHYHVRVDGEGWNDKNGNGKQDDGPNDPTTDGKGNELILDPDSP